MGWEGDEESEEEELEEMEWDWCSRFDLRRSGVDVDVGDMDDEEDRLGSMGLRVVVKMLRLGRGRHGWRVVIDR